MNEQDIKNYYAPVKEIQSNKQEMADTCNRAESELGKNTIECRIKNLKFIVDQLEILKGMLPSKLTQEQNTAVSIIINNLQIK